MENQLLDPHAPLKEILEAFHLKGGPVRLAGGGGKTYRVDDAVLKHTRDEQMMSWLAEITENLKSDKFRVPKPLKSRENTWVYQGWIAHRFEEGRYYDDKYAESIMVCRDFHKAIAGIPKPDFFDRRTDVFHLADKMAWGELSLPDFSLTNVPLKRLFGSMQELNLPKQLIHGDWGPGNILFHDQLVPAVIDISPYFRPADFPVPVMMIDALAEGSVSAAILDLGRNIKHFDQLLRRALARRILEWVGFAMHPENDQDRTPEIFKRLDLIDLVLGRS